jgi:general secretion pathway protein G
VAELPVRHPPILDYAVPQRVGVPRVTTVVLLSVATALFGFMLGLAVLLPKFVTKGTSAKITACKADIATFDGQLESFLSDCGRYPTAEEGLQALVSDSLIEGWKGPYLRSVPLDPWGTPYRYVEPGVHNAGGVDICSAGPDRQVGTGDDVTNW